MKTPLWVWVRLLEADVSLHSDPTGELKKPDILISSHVKKALVFSCLCPLPPSSKPKRILPVRVRTESGAGPFLAQPLGLAQRLLRCSKAPEHASETPSFTAWLAGPHPHTQLNQMLHDLAHQISGEHVLHPTVKWLQIHLLGFSVS